MDKNFISSKEIVKKFGISYSTLVHYTNLGLLRTVARTGNKRLYERQGVRTRIPRIKRLVNSGYPLRLIAQRLNNGLS